MDDGVEPVDAHFLEAVAALRPASPRGPGPAGAPGSALTGARCLDLFDAQLGSRHLDLAARWLRARGQGFYTIGSAGHEGNAAVAAALRPTDPALLHYRSGAFYLARRPAGAGGTTRSRDVLLGLVAAAERADRGRPAQGVRPSRPRDHPADLDDRVATCRARSVSPSPSTRGPPARRAARAWPADAIAVCSFGDASANHSTALGALNTAACTALPGLPLPLLFVCEDNGLGISVQHAAAAGSRRRSGTAAGLRTSTPTAATWPRRTTRRARRSQHVRGRRAPGVPAPATRSGSWATPGTDAETAYRSPRRDRGRLRRATRCWARRACSSTPGMLTPDEVLDAVRGDRARRCCELADEVAERRRSSTARPR